MGTQRRSRLTAVRLVRSVLTVVLLIAGPAHGDAAAAGAGEEVDRALEFPLVWKKTKKYIRHQSLSPPRQAGGLEKRNTLHVLVMYKTG